MLLCIQARCIGKMGIFHSQLLGLLIHHADKGIFTPRYRLCQHNSGIGDLLDPQLILCDADFQDKNDALDTMCTMLMEKGCVKPEFLLSVYKRENLGVTCLPGHIAIPHGEPAYVTKPAICVAKICHPLDWTGGFVAEIVFLFALDEKCQGFVQNFCDIIKDENNVKKLLSAKNAKEIYDFLK